MVDEARLRRWKNVRCQLGAARELVKNDEKHRAISQRGNSLASFSEYLEHNELELALEQLEILGEKNRLTGDFWLHLAMAARCMDLSQRYESALQRFRVGVESNVQLEKIAECALRELTDQRLGVTEQFFAVHQPEPDAIAHLFADGDRGRAWVRIRGERYFWVVNAQRDVSGTWSAHWGRAAHRAKVYLAIYSDDLSPDKISDRLGFAPSSSNFKGRKISKRPESQRRFDSHRWYFDSPAHDVEDFETRLGALILAIEPLKLSLVELSIDCRCGINTAIYDAAGQGYGFSLDQSTIQKLAAARLTINFDMYHSGPDLPE